MVSTQNQKATIYNAFGIIKGSVEPGKAFSLVWTEVGKDLLYNPNIGGNVSNMLKFFSFYICQKCVPVINKSSAERGNIRPLGFLVRK